MSIWLHRRSSFQKNLYNTSVLFMSREIHRSLTVAACGFQLGTAFNENLHNIFKATIGRCMESCLAPTIHQSVPVADAGDYAMQYFFVEAPVRCHLQFVWKVAICTIIKQKADNLDITVPSCFIHRRFTVSTSSNGCISAVTQQVAHDIFFTSTSSLVQRTLSVKRDCVATRSFFQKKFYNTCVSSECSIVERCLLKIVKRIDLGAMIQQCPDDAAL